ncbi:hypothetical protein MNVI_26050 [Mycobacterium noviomagense]|uniref:Uncharacterized protein n=1 Tax=Mycobacterium noviomagense TaxID=459858 RepID=A0A7I7PF65_9MYCO|nr:hypothetical protein MNVI_26050 [Mycobacterium noviomagense]
MIQVTVLPAATASFAGTKAKLSMLTASPFAGAGGPLGDAVPDGAPGIDGMALMPGIPGVALVPDPNVTDG